MTPPPRAGFEDEQRAETWLVLWVCGGLSIVTSLVRLFQAQPGPILFTTPRLLYTVSAEICLAIAFVPFLRARGWRLSDMTRPFELLDIVWGIALWIGVYGLHLATVAIVRAMGPTAMGLLLATRFRAQVPLAVVAIAAVIDPIFEEFFYFGYTFNALRRHSVKVAFAAAVLLRVAIHVYQGWLALVFVAPLAVLFTFFFLRTNRIWPVIVAHAIQDFVALAALSTHATSQ